MHGSIVHHECAYHPTAPSFLFFYLHSLDVSRSVLAELSRQHEVIFGARGRLMDTQSTATERDGILSLVRIFLYCMCAIIIMVPEDLGP